MTLWKAIHYTRFDDMLGMLPPALHLYRGFLFGEAFDHGGPDGAVRFIAFLKHGNQYFESLTPLTQADFLKLDPAKIAAQYGSI